MQRFLSGSWFLKAWLPAVILLFLFIGACHWRVEKNAAGRTYFSIEEIPYNRVGLLLGTCKTMKDKKTINPFWQSRLEAAVRLYNARKIDRILVSGDNGWYGYNEPEDFREALLTAGVPDSVIYCDYAGFRTHDSVIRCKKVFGQSSVTMISQQFHNERALLIADAYGLKAVGYNASDVSWRNNIYNTFREALARVLLHLDIYVLHTDPHFLGNAELIK